MNKQKKKERKKEINNNWLNKYVKREDFVTQLFWCGRGSYNFNVCSAEKTLICKGL